MNDIPMLNAVITVWPHFSVLPKRTSWKGTVIVGPKVKHIKPQPTEERARAECYATALRMGAQVEKK